MKGVLMRRKGKRSELSDVLAVCTQLAMTFRICIQYAVVENDLVLACDERIREENSVSLTEHLLMRTI